MRILMLTDFYLPFVGGVAQHVSTLSQGLVERGHDVAVVTLEAPGLPSYEEDAVRVYRVRGTAQRIPLLFQDRNRRWAPPLPDPELSWALRRIVRQERPDVVHAHTWFVHSFVPLKPRSGARLVLSLHEYGLVCAKKSPIYRGQECSGPGFTKCIGCSSRYYGIAKGATLALAVGAMAPALKAAVDMFLPVSPSTARGTGLVGSDLPFQVIPNFLPDDEPSDETESAPYISQLPAQPYLLFVGVLGRHKGIDVLMDAYAGIDNAPPLVLIGSDWSDTPSHFPPGCVVLKNWPHHAVMAALRRSLMLILPSVVPEAQPRVIIEAMATSRPVVASNIGALPDLVAEAESGLLVSPGDSDGLRRAIMRLLADPELRDRMGQLSGERFDGFRASRVVPRFEQVYQDVMNRPPARRRRVVRALDSRPESALTESRR